MSGPTVNPISFRFPFELRDQHPEVVQAFRYHSQGLVDLNQAVKSLRSQIVALKPATGTTTTVASSTSIVVNSSSFAGLGSLRDETGQTSYTIVGADNGILLVLNDASPVAVSLDSAMVTPYFLFVANFGAGSATLSPTSGTINGAASFTLPQNFLTLVVFGGTNWTATPLLVLAQTAGPTAHQWLSAYNATTGAFTLSQPAFTDISGSLAVGQLPSSVPQCSFGTGAPAGSSTEGFLYFDTTASPYTEYVYHSGAWHQVA